MARFEIGSNPCLALRFALWIWFSTSTCPDLGSKPYFDLSRMLNFYMLLVLAGSSSGFYCKIQLVLLLANILGASSTGRKLFTRPPFLMWIFEIKSSKIKIPILSKLNYLCIFRVLTFFPLKETLR